MSIAVKNVAIMLNAGRFTNGFNPKIAGAQFREFRKAEISQVILPVPKNLIGRIESELPYQSGLTAQCLEASSALSSVEQATKAATYYLNNMVEAPQKTFFLISDARLFFDTSGNRSSLGAPLMAHEYFSRQAPNENFATMVSFSGRDQMERFGIMTTPENNRGWHQVQKIPYGLEGRFHIPDFLMRQGVFILPDSFFDHGVKGGQIFSGNGYVDFDSLWAILGNSPEDITRNEGDLLVDLHPPRIGVPVRDLLADLFQWKESCRTGVWFFEGEIPLSWETQPELQPRK